MTTAEKLLTYLANSPFTPGSDSYGMAGLKWMHDNDPTGKGSLNSDKSLITFNFNDGSCVVLPTKGRAIYQLKQ